MSVEDKVHRIVLSLSDLGHEANARKIRATFSRSGRSSKQLRIDLLEAKALLLDDLLRLRSDATTARKEHRAAIRTTEAAVYAIEDAR